MVHAIDMAVLSRLNQLPLRARTARDDLSWAVARCIDYGHDLAVTAHRFITLPDQSSDALSSMLIGEVTAVIDDFSHYWRLLAPYRWPMRELICGATGTMARTRVRGSDGESRTRQCRCSHEVLSEFRRRFALIDERNTSIVGLGMALCVARCNGMMLAVLGRRFLSAPDTPTRDSVLLRAFDVMTAQAECIRGIRRTLRSVRLPPEGETCGFA
jgi:hypothetical protein